jgi:hypothetical protein
MSGKAATFGGRVMGPVSDQILGQFAANFSARVQAMQVQRTAPEASGTGAPSSAAAQTSGPGAGEPKPLNGLALMWAVFKGWLRSLFAAKKS